MDEMLNNEIDTVYCIGANKFKLLFKTQEDALEFIALNNTSIKQYPYFCVCCNGFHLTSQKTHKKRNRRYTKVSEPNIVDAYMKLHPLKHLTLRDIIIK